MDIDSIISLALGLLGGGAGGGILGWRMQRKKQAAEVKADEIENMRKAMEDFYDPLLKKQNARIAELEGEVKTLRDQLAYERTEHQKQIDSLQKQITDITRALGIKAAKQIRNGKGQFTSEKVEEPTYEG